MACQEVPRRQDWIVRLPARDFFFFFFLSPPSPPPLPKSFCLNKTKNKPHAIFILFCFRPSAVSWFVSSPVVLFSLFLCSPLCSVLFLHFNFTVCLVSVGFTPMGIPLHPHPPNPASEAALPKPASLTANVHLRYSKS